MPSNVYDVMQEMGELNYDGQEFEPPNTYHMYLSLSILVSLYLPVKMKTNNKLERNLQLAKFMEVLGFFLLPTSCSHNFLETYFA
jgi:hypothetical protein